MIPQGRAFYKMSGSGNDFVMIDARAEPPGELEGSDAVRALSAHGTGIGADGVVFLERSSTADLGIRYFNSDGSLASLCGNATLCSARLAVELGIVDPAGFRIETGAGVLPARIRDGLPEVDLAAIAEVSADGPIETQGSEQRSGYLVAGVPHVTILVPDVGEVDVVGRGRPIRLDPRLPHGANANFVSPDGPGRWRIRTYERGVEAETLACGTGAVASAILLTAWGEARGDAELVTKSGRPLRVRLRQDAEGRWHPSLSGHAAVVFTGKLSEVLT
ncbi:MAG: diaminopimelate epimerase [Gemmatimonadaceae bacterium]|nr:diaminopimelate epimerase [Gemmatimonadaceae bacterium]